MSTASENNVHGLRRVAQLMVGTRVAPAPSLRDILIAVSIVLGGGVAAYLHLPASTRNLLWAEDGSIFVTDALAGAPFHNLLTPYAGYMQGFPQFVTSVVVAIAPLRVVPAVLVVISVLTASTIAGATFVLLRDRVSPIVARLAIALAIAVSPVAGIEASGSIASTHFFLLVGLFVVLVTRESSRLVIVLECLLVVFAVTSDPLSLLFLPFAVAQILAGSSRSRLWVPCVYLVALIVQLVYVVTSRSPSEAQPFTPLALVRSVGFRVFLAGLVGPYAAAHIYAHLGIVALVVSTLIVVIVCVIPVLRRSPEAALVIVCFLTSLGFYIASAVVRWFPGLDPDVNLAWGGSRYSIVSICILVIAVAAAVSSLASASPGPRGLALPLILVAVVFFGTASSWELNVRAESNTWSAQLAHARSQCQSRPSAASVTIPISPANFSVVLKCSVVARS
jgi:hypothetical protein